MKYECFEDLPVWQAAADLAAKLFVWTEHPGFRGKGELAIELQRAGLSISNSIAQGFERGTPEELLSCLDVARGSASEVRSMLSLVGRMMGFGESSSELSELKQSCQAISNQLISWVQSLQDGASDSQASDGQSYLTQRSRARFEYRRRLERQDGQQRDWASEFETRLKSPVSLQDSQTDEMQIEINEPEPDDSKP